MACVLPSACYQALQHYDALDGVALDAERSPAQLRVSPLGDGLINETYLVELFPRGAPAPGAATGATPAAQAVLQRVNPLFAIAVHHDIEAVTRHLAQRGLTTPLLLRTRNGELAVDLREHGVWRLLTFIPGLSTAVMTPQMAGAAGELVGRFHAALLDLRHTFHFTREGAHDLQRHLGALQAALAQARTRCAPPEFFPLAEEILERAAALDPHVPGPLRLCHGDLKLSNLRFSPAFAGICLLDLDTLAYLPLAIELGDALRSWCNRCGEDDPQGRFDLQLFELAVRGYAGWARPFMTAPEREALVAGVLRIALQLAARFAADVINDRYFRWNAARFASRAAHNLVRASSQLHLAHSLVAQRAPAEALVAQIFRSQ